LFYHGFTHIIPHLHVSFLIQVPSRRGHQDLRPAAEVRLGLHGRLLLSRHAAEDDASTALCWGAKHRFFAAKICKDQMFFFGKSGDDLVIFLGEPSKFIKRIGVLTWSHKLNGDISIKSCVEVVKSHPYLAVEIP